MFAIFTSEREQAENMAAVLTSEGFDVELQDQTDGGWVVAAVPREPLDVALTRERVNELAAEHDGDFLGHGGTISIGLAG